MARKPNPIIIEPEKFSDYLIGVQGGLGLNIAGLAKKLGISRAATYQLINGEIGPSEKTLEKLGLEIVYRQRMPK